jgi:hypothetical protein
MTRSRCSFRKSSVGTLPLVNVSFALKMTVLRRFCPVATSVCVAFAWRKSIAVLFVVQRLARMLVIEKRKAVESQVHQPPMPMDFKLKSFDFIITNIINFLLNNYKYLIILASYRFVPTIQAQHPAAHLIVWHVGCGFMTSVGFIATYFLLVSQRNGKKETKKILL